MAILTPIVHTSSTQASVLEKAEAAKQKGNDLFKGGLYAESIGPYSEAHLLVPSSPIYLLNRAQAYLNLSKFTDAERDCSTSIALDGGATSTKAWFRRGVARRGLGDWKGARDDFAKVLKLDPKMSASVKVELNKVKVDEEAEALKKGKGKKVVSPSLASKPKPPPATSSLPPKPTTSIATPPPPPKSYPIPIKMVYPSSPSPPPSPPTPSPPSSTITTTTKPDPTSSIFPTKPKAKPTPAPTFASLQTARNAKPSLPLPPSTISPKPSPTTTKSSSKKVVHPKPTSAHALHKTLLAMEGGKDEAFEFLVSLPPSSLPTIIGSSLEPALFSLLLSILESSPAGYEDETEAVGRALEGTQRFGLAKMMTERGEERWAGLRLPEAR